MRRQKTLVRLHLWQHLSHKAFLNDIFVLEDEPIHVDLVDVGVRRQQFHQRAEEELRQQLLVAKRDVVLAFEKEGDFLPEVVAFVVSPSQQPPHHLLNNLLNRLPSVPLPYPHHILKNVLLHHFARHSSVEVLLDVRVAALAVDDGEVLEVEARLVEDRLELAETHHWEVFLVELGAEGLGFVGEQEGQLADLAGLDPALGGVLVGGGDVVLYAVQHELRPNEGHLVCSRELHVDRQVLNQFVQKVDPCCIVSLVMLAQVQYLTLLQHPILYPRVPFQRLQLPWNHRHFGHILGELRLDQPHQVLELHQARQRHPDYKVADRRLHDEVVVAVLVLQSAGVLGVPAGDLD